LKFAVIGSNSFSGSHLVAYLLRLGIPTLGVSRSPEPRNLFLPRTWKQSNCDFTFKQLDLNLDSEILGKTLNDFNATHIINFAAQSMVGQSWTSPEDWYETNVVAISKLANYIQQIPTLEKFIQVSTPEVYGSTANWISEGHPFNPSTPYAASRAAADIHLRLMASHQGLPVIFTRAANVYGPGQQPYRVVPKAAILANKLEPFALEGGGLSQRSFIHISDVVEATFLISQKGQLGDDYHISTDELISIRDLVKKVYEHSGFKNLEQDQAVADRLGKDSGYFLASNKIRDELEWSPKVTLDQGLVDTIQWVRENANELSTMNLNYIHKK
jgi:dTDP-glucose 4,6-dehydratase